MNRRRMLTWLAGIGLVAGLAPARVLAAKSAHELSGQALDRLEAGRLDEALEILAEARRLDPRDDRVRALLGRVYFQKGDPRRALEEFRLAVRFNPEDTQSRIMVETIGQFPLPAGGEQERSRSQGRPSALEREARAERESLMAGDAAARPGTAPFRLLLDPGHGGMDPGAAGPGLREADVTLDVALRLARSLAGTARGRVEVSLTRVADAGLPGWARATLAAWYDADLLLSLHATRLPDPGLGGLAVFGPGGQASDALAAAVAKVENAAHGPGPAGGTELEMGLPTRAVHRAAGAGLLRRAGEMAGILVKTMSAAAVPLTTRAVGLAPLRLLLAADTPAVLVETGLLSNPGDAAALGDAGKRQALADALAKAVMAVAGP